MVAGKDPGYGAKVYGYRPTGSVYGQADIRTSDLDNQSIQGVWIIEGFADRV